MSYFMAKYVSTCDKENAHISYIDLIHGNMTVRHLLENKTSGRGLNLVIQEFSNLYIPQEKKYCCC